MKRTKESAGFEHPAKGKEHCSQCVHFIQLADRCKIVQGEVLPVDWCEQFRKRVV